MGQKSETGEEKMKQHLNGINALFIKPLVATLILAGYTAGLFGGSF